MMWATPSETWWGSLFMLVVGALLMSAASSPGATYGKDYAGLDYNVTQWHSPQSMSPNHWEAAADLCMSYCLNDTRCCSWTYCTPEAGSSDPERCCLKYGVPEEIAAKTHWTGLSPRWNSSQCQNPAPGPPFPGPDFLHPKVHYSPNCLHNGGWHDIAAAITINGTHHAFQGCPVSNGWHHGISTDLLHWTSLGIDPARLHETYAGMDSYTSPCSGFVVLDDDGIPCAGFRQCGSTQGVHGGQPWDVPLEVRCATDTNVTKWQSPDYLYDAFFFRALPYDPVRPWQEDSGVWYSTIATDACNATQQKPCPSGSALQLYSSPALRGPKANWTKIGVMFQSNRTVLSHGAAGGDRYNEFVTPNYIGGLRGDPLNGRTRVVTDNGYGGYTMYFIGTQQEGKAFVNDWSKDGTIGAMDYGAFRPNFTPDAHGFAALANDKPRTFGMARTLAGSSNQVNTPNQRHVVLAWLMASTASMSFPRDLTLSDSGLLLQQFIPELTQLRTGDAIDVPLHANSMQNNRPSRQAQVAGQQLELVADFTVSNRSLLVDGCFGVHALVGDADDDYVAVGVNLTSSLAYVSSRDDMRAGPLNFSQPFTADHIHMHMVVDHSILTVIVNNMTAITTFPGPATQDSGGIGTFGLGPGVEADVQAWQLVTANNVD